MPIAGAQAIQHMELNKVQPLNIPQVQQNTKDRQTDRQKCLFDQINDIYTYM